MTSIKIISPYPVFFSLLRFKMKKENPLQEFELIWGNTEISRIFHEIGIEKLGGWHGG